jgi:hypothetical protein
MWEADREVGRNADMRYRKRIGDNRERDTKIGGKAEVRQ